MDTYLHDCFIGNTLKIIILTMLSLITLQAYAGDLIILDRYHLEKSESSATDFGVENKQSNNVSAEIRGERVVRGEETDIDTQVNSHNRNINSFVIRKGKRNVKNREDSSLLEYHF